MGVRRRRLLGTILVGVACALLLVVNVDPASALTADQKTQLYDLCRRNGNSVQVCCHVIGGQYEAIFDEKGNLIGEACTYSSDNSQTTHPGPGLTNSNVQYNRNLAAIDTSGDASGGVSNAGVNGIQQIFEPVNVIP